VTATLAVASVLAIAPGNQPGKHVSGHAGAWIIGIIIVVGLSGMAVMFGVLRSRK
jgi:hypothetical protein